MSRGRGGKGQGGSAAFARARARGDSGKGRSAPPTPFTHHRVHEESLFSQSRFARCLHRRFTLCVRAVSSQVSRIDDNVELRNRRSSITGGDSSAGQPGDDKAQPQYRQVRQDWCA